MNTDIRELTQRFLDGQTTLEEERRMAEYFRTHKVSDELKPIQEMFAYFDRGMVEPENQTADTKPSPLRTLWRWAIGVAAVLTAAAFAIRLIPHQTTPPSTPTESVLAQTPAVNSSDGEEGETSLMSNATSEKSREPARQKTTKADDYEQIEIEAEGVALFEGEVMENAEPENAIQYGIVRSEPETMTTENAEPENAIQYGIVRSEPRAMTTGYAGDASEIREWLVQRYRQGYRPAEVDSFSIFSDPRQEWYFKNMPHRLPKHWIPWFRQCEYFGTVQEDERGIYVPWVKDVVLELNMNGREHSAAEHWMKDFLRLADVADDAITSTQTDTTNGNKGFHVAFAFGGSVKDDEHTNDEDGQDDKKNQTSFEFVPNFSPSAGADSYWWGDAELTADPRYADRLRVMLHSVDKLYAKDCPDIAQRRFRVEGDVYEQYKDAHGMVVEQPLPFVKVHIAGTAGRRLETSGVMTNSKGHFTMWLPSEDTPIEVVAIGWEIVSVRPKAKMKIVLKNKNLRICHTYHDENNANSLYNDGYVVYQRWCQG